MKPRSGRLPDLAAVVIAELQFATLALIFISAAQLHIHCSPRSIQLPPLNDSNGVAYLSLFSSQVLLPATLFL